MTTSDYTLEVPYGYCHCGCGNMTTLAKVTCMRDKTIKDEPLRFIAGHQSHLRSLKTSISRFWSKVDKSDSDSCWEWTGSLISSGYGRFWLERALLLSAVEACLYLDDYNYTTLWN